MREYKKEDDLDLVKLAYEFAEKAHGDQKRKSGEPYIIHPLSAAITLAKMKLDPSIIIAALLHDVPEDTGVSIDVIKKEFGKDVALMVEGVTKLGKIKYRGVERYIENLRKMFVAMANDLRVIIIKFADRLHNLKTLDVLPRDKQERIAREVLEIYAPIASRLGMDQIKGAMEDEAFKHFMSKEYKWATGLVEKQLSQREKTARRVQKILEQDLKENDIEVKKIYGRAKRIYSLYLKLLRNDREIARIYDLVAIRVILKDVASCYSVLGIIHKRWAPVSGRIKDYIAVPKPNGYQSIHTTVFVDDGELVEFQIRTEEMDENAEFGVAAHWHYKEKGKAAAARNMKWVGELTKWKKEIEENQKYLENLKLDTLQSRIFVFTPAGDVIDLPEGATPVDFAYHVHTDIGDKCGGATVDDQIVNLDTKLKNGNVVEIIIDKNRKGPNPDWLKFVKTGLARTRIKAASRSQRNSFFGRIVPF